MTIAFIKKSIFISLSAVLMFGSMWLAAPMRAMADENSNSQISEAEAQLQDADAVLNEAQAELDSISEEYKQLSAEISAIQDQVNDLASKVLEAQQEMLEGRTALSTTVLNEYRNNTFNTMISVLLGSSDWSELTRNMNYVDQIMSYQANEVAEQKDLKEKFKKVSNELTEQKNQQEVKLAELNQKRTEAMRVVDEASAKVAEDTERLDELRRQAQQFIWTSTHVPAVDAQGDQEKPEGESPEDTANNQQDLSVTQKAEAPVVVPNQTQVDSMGWSSGMASAYGGSSDPWTSNPGTTANGSICDDNSMGVAIPLSWPNRSSYYGRTIEISYNGMTVYGVINDCGNLQNYGRVLDLQPGIFKAFGFQTCQAWGQRNVSYRIL